MVKETHLHKKTMWLSKNFVNVKCFKFVELSYCLVSPTFAELKRIPCNFGHFHGRHRLFSLKFYWAQWFCGQTCYGFQPNRFIFCWLLQHLSLRPNRANDLVKYRNLGQPLLGFITCQQQLAGYETICDLYISHLATVLHSFCESTWNYRSKTFDVCFQSV